ncbi:MAG: glycosyltransferase [Rubrivivax sp.]|nr:glycosyltransferase [Pyrinomonadaceae bacterium]
MTTAKSQNEPEIDPQQTRATRRLWIKERVYESRALQQLYASWEGAASRVALRRGRPYEAARRMLHVWRHLGAESIGPKRMARLMRVVRDNCYRDGQLAPAAENRLRLDFIRSAQGRELRGLYGAFPAEHRVRLRFPRPDSDPERQGDLIVLKPYDPVTGERGVLMVMYGEGIRAMAAVYDLAAIAERYTLVLETSGWGYQEISFFLYLGSDLDVLVQSPRREDFEFISGLESNLIPVRAGSGEWVDPAIFRPRAAGDEAKFDVVMVAAWDPLKRHELLLRAVARLRRERGEALRIALVGYAMGWPRSRVERLLRRYGLEDDCAIFERIPHAEVARIVSESKVSLLLSRQEGSNRSVYESMFCGTPVIVYRQHRGINLEHINARTGLLADDDELAGAIAAIVDRPEAFDPRGWALENIGYENATRIVSGALREQAARRGLLWTHDIAAKKNAPNLRYAEAGLYKSFEAEYDRLKDFLLPLD